MSHRKRASTRRAERAKNAYSVSTGRQTIKVKKKKKIKKIRNKKGEEEREVGR
jgi:hypothetical protein